MLPLAKPAMVTLGVFIFLNEWSSFVWPLIILSDWKKYPVTVGIALFRDVNQINWPAVFAGSTIVSFPIIILFVLAQEYYHWRHQPVGVEGVESAGRREKVALGCRFRYIGSPGRALYPRPIEAGRTHFRISKVQRADGSICLLPDEHVGAKCPRILGTAKAKPTLRSFDYIAGQNGRRCFQECLADCLIRKIGLTARAGDVIFRRKGFLKPSSFHTHIHYRDRLNLINRRLK